MDELEDVLSEPFAYAYLESLGITVSDAWTLVKLLDRDKTGTIDLDEFLKGCMDLRGNAKAVHVATLAYDQHASFQVLEEFMDMVDDRLSTLVGTLARPAADVGSVPMEAPAGEEEQEMIVIA